MDNRPRRAPFEIDYKNNRDVEINQEDNNIDPFGYDEPDFLNPNENIEKEESNQKGGTVSWLEEEDNLNLPSRTYYNENKREIRHKIEEKNEYNSHKNLGFYDRNNNSN